MFQRSNISVNSLDLCADKIQRFEVFLDTVFGKNKSEDDPYIGKFFTYYDISRSDNLHVRILVNVMFINKTISIVKVPMRLRSSTLELTGVYFRGELNHFGHMGRQNIILGRKRAQKCLISICSFNSIL